MNVGNTAFVSLGWTKGSPLPPADSPTQIRRTVRWYTPTNEARLCGQATLGSSFALLTHFRNSNGEEPEFQEIRFESKFRGTLTASLDKIENKQYVTLDFPANMTEPARTIDKLQVRDVYLGANFTPDDIMDVHVCALEKVALLRLENNGTDPEERIKQVQPNFEAMLGVKMNGTKILGAITTIQGNGDEKGPDFYSRVFLPGMGILEDPVCGMAHTIMVPFWTAELAKETGVALVARQVSGRGGDLRVKLNGERVSLSGRGRVVVTGTLNL